MIEASGAEMNRLSLQQFTRLMRTFDWESADGSLGESVYEVDFAKEKLGFRVGNIKERGVIVV